MKIFQTYSGEFQRKQLWAESIPYDYTNNGGTEYEVFKDIYKAIPSTWGGAWGALSWKFNTKSYLSLGEFHDLAVVEMANGADCVFINPMIANEALFENVWEQGIVVNHHGLEVVVQFLLTKGYLRASDWFMSKEVFSFCNYFVGTRVFWRRYFDFVDSVLLDLEKDRLGGGAAGVAISNPAGYHKNKSMTLKPFVVERLFSTFLLQSGLKTSAINANLPSYTYKLGDYFGRGVHELSRLKNAHGQDRDFPLDRRIWKLTSDQIIRSSSFATLMSLDDPDTAFLTWGLSK